MPSVPPPRVRAAPPDPAPPEPELDPEFEAELEAPERAARSIEQPRTRLTPEDVAALNQTWRDNVLGDDDYSRRTAKECVTRLRRATHQEIHPGCERVTIDVPQLPNGHFVRINNRQYIGRMELWQCEAQTVLTLAHTALDVEAARMRDDGRTVDLDREALQARARLIASA